MSCFERTPFYQDLRHQLDKQQEIRALPYAPILRVYNNKYYFVEESSSNERTSDVVVPLKGTQKTKVERESSIDSIKRATRATVQHTSIITQDYNTALNSIHCQPFVACCCAYPYCDITNINQRNFAPTYDTEKTYFQQLQALNSFLLPNVGRMAYEREKLNVEHSTKDYDTSMANKRGKLSLSATSGKDFEKVSETNPGFNVENIRDEKLPFLQTWSTRKDFKMEKSISKKTQRINLEQKRKLESSESETREDRDQKRFKSETNQNTTRDAWLESRPHVDIEKQFNYSKLKKDFTSTSGGISSIMVAKERDVLALQSKDNASKRGAYETKCTTFSSSESLKRRNHVSRVGEGASRRHVQPVSPAERFGLARNRNSANQTNYGQQQRSTNQFISLDSTKSSFLTLMKKIRGEPKDDVISCPYCCQTFTEYPVLRIHVQTHRDTRTSAGHNVSDVGGQKDNCLSCHSGNEMKTPNFPVVVQNLTDDTEAKKRPTSVIKFAGQNN